MRLNQIFPPCSVFVCAPDLKMCIEKLFFFLVSPLKRETENCLFFGGFTRTYKPEHAQKKALETKRK